MSNQGVGRAVRERSDVWVLSEEDPWHPTIEWYARAVVAMQGRDGTNFADPTSWRHLAETHGTSIRRSSWPRGALWNECEHSSWFFLPWHRIYLHHFEKIVRASIVALGGPGDWALPYWDYSDPDRPQTRQLPPAFRARAMPDGSRNPLFVAERGPAMNDDGAVPAASVRIDRAFRETKFTERDGDMIPGFGGPVTGRNHRGGPVGSLEASPHGSIHVDVGGVQPPGWMSRFETAGRDPIFWLHHANIDRLWESWRRLGGGPRNPPARAWLTQPFQFGGGAAPTALAVGDVLDTTAAPLQYRYARLSVPGGQPVSAAQAAALAGALEPPDEGPEEAMAERPPPEMVGATDTPVPLTDAPSVAEVPVGAPTGPVRSLLQGEDRPPEVYLRVENVTGTELTAGSYVVHVNLPEGADPAQFEDRRAGQVSMFGVVESSATDDVHSGSGLTFAFDITDVARHLEAAGEWDPERLRLTFTPVPDAAGRVYPGDVSVGRVSVYYG